MECLNCNWEWEIESDDDRPHLCHKCGYDSKDKEFDYKALKEWQKENGILEVKTFDDYYNDKPYKQYKEGGYIIREFSENVNPFDLKWHRDKKDRVVKVLENNGWKFQFDNNLPFVLEDTIYIPKEKYHRVIKGDGKLKIRIKE